MIRGYSFVERWASGWVSILLYSPRVCVYTIIGAYYQRTKPKLSISLSSQSASYWRSRKFQSHPYLPKTQRLRNPNPYPFLRTIISSPKYGESSESWDLGTF